MFRTDLADACGRNCSAVHGIGPETADSILLYAGGLPSFVVDAYTYRIFARHGWIGFDADYDQIQDYFQSGLPDDAAMYNEYPCPAGARGQGLLPQGAAEVPGRVRCASCCPRAARWKDE